MADAPPPAQPIRRLRFESLAEIRADAEALDGRPLRTSGQWTPAQIVRHIADAIAGSLDGFAVMAPPEMRARAAAGRERLLRDGLRPGIRVADEYRALMPDPSATWEAALAALRAAIARAETETMHGEHPILGPFDHEQWRAFHCRHAELHFGFMDVAVPPSA